MLEAALLAFHWSCNERIVFITDELDRDTFKLFKIKLQFLGQATQHYMKQIESTHRSPSPVGNKATRNHLSNIQKAIKDFFHSPLTEMHSSLWPSWRRRTDRVITPPPRLEWEMSRKRRPNSRNTTKFSTIQYDAAPKMSRREWFENRRGGRSGRRYYDSGWNGPDDDHYYDRRRRNRRW
ncbi:hypothetical protein ACOME3_004843 [Neoechinorhynchus agilis]